MSPRTIASSMQRLVNTRRIQAETTGRLSTMEDPHPRNRLLIVAQDYQFLDTVHGGNQCIQEWQVANSLERLTELVMPAPLAVVVDLELPCALDALNLLGALRVDSRIVLLTSGDLSKHVQARRIAAAIGLDIVGTLQRPLMLA